MNTCSYSKISVNSERHFLISSLFCRGVHFSVHIKPSIVKGLYSFTGCRQKSIRSCSWHQAGTPAGDAVYAHPDCPPHSVSPPPCFFLFLFFIFFKDIQWQINWQENDALVSQFTLHNCIHIFLWPTFSNSRVAKI